MHLSIQGFILRLKKAILTASLLLLLALSGCSNTGAKNNLVNYAKSDSDYLALKQTIVNKLADTTSFDRILNIYPMSSFYDPKSDIEPAGKLLSEQYMQVGNYSACLQVADKMLAVNYTSLTAHFATSECARLSGDLSRSQFHNWVLDNFIEAIWRTGDGQSAQSAFMINSSSDLYAFIQLHQLVAVGQDLVYLQQIPIQKIRIQTPETNRSFTWYFNVTPQFRRGLIDQIESR